MGLEVSKEDITELVEIGNIDLSTEDPLALQQEQQQGSQQEEQEDESRQVNGLIPCIPVINCAEFEKE
ncbi:hypothetical protein JRQ81_005059 [Phrynocephalus forsythii]|uniref:Uncharacterized protein n=1 Tax=Phrynocephalus forsythii TaxID=171643 RepID=A0A9Q0XI22_9SAUR|nr:hypothetical protein JRQ81_005059 [Phrynocephalus forsythii]